MKYWLSLLLVCSCGNTADPGPSGTDAGNQDVSYADTNNQPPMDAADANGPAACVVDGQMPLYCIGGMEFLVDTSDNMTRYCKDVKHCEGVKDCQTLDGKKGVCE